MKGNIIVKHHYKHLKTKERNECVKKIMLKELNRKIKKIESKTPLP